MKSFRERTSLALALACGFLWSCHAPSMANVPPLPLHELPNGVSGMAPIGPRAFVVVHDVKGAAPAGDRLGLLSIGAKGGVTYERLDVAWGDRVASDLEAACAVPARSNEVLVAESRGGGCVFHARIDRGTARILGCIPTPSDVVEMEGLACTADARGNLWLVLGERGGEPGSKSGRIRWGLADLDAHAFREVGRAPIVSPGDAHTDTEHQRHVADLWLDPSATLWAAGSEDPGDGGPFRSVIYRAGTFRVDGTTSSTAFTPAPDAAPIWIEGLKVEAVSAPVDTGSRLSVASDDEALGGVWRPIR